MNTNERLKALTDKIYVEGINKAKVDAEQIIAKANEQASSIVNEAKLQGEAIIELAKKQADELKYNMHSEIRLAAQQLTSNLKSEIHKKVLNAQVAVPIKKGLEDKEFVQKMMLALIDKWNPQKSGSASVSLLLPAEDENRLNEFFNAKAVEAMNAGFEIHFTPEIKNGFKIEPKDSNFQIDFTDQAFESYFKSYLKEKTKKLIFN